MSHSYCKYNIKSSYSARAAAPFPAAITSINASVKNDTTFKDKFQCGRESLYGHDGDEDLIVTVPYETVLQVLPTGMSPSEMDDKLRKDK